MHVMILAAGRGERLRPLTDHTPKPLIEVGGKPLIIHHLERLAAAGFRDIVINLAWLGGRIRRSLGDGGRWGLSIQYSEEAEGALETAGGIIQALPLLGEGCFAVINADILTDYPFDGLRPPARDDLAHLVMVDNPSHHPTDDFLLAGTRLSEAGGTPLTFSGIGVYRPALFAGLPAGRRALAPLLRAAIHAGRVSAEHFSGRWHDTGTPERLARARVPAQKHEPPRAPRAPRKNGG